MGVVVRVLILVIYYQGTRDRSFTRRAFLRNLRPFVIMADVQKGCDGITEMLFRFYRLSFFLT